MADPVLEEDERTKRVSKKNREGLTQSLRRSREGRPSFQEKGRTDPISRRRGKGRPGLQQKGRTDPVSRRRGKADSVPRRRGEPTPSLGEKGRPT